MKQGAINQLFLRLFLVFLTSLNHGMEGGRIFILVFLGHKNENQLEKLEAAKAA